MKTFNIALQNHWRSPTPNFASCLLLLRKDNIAFTYTSLDDDINFDIYADRLINGAGCPSWMNIGPQLYRANPGHALQDMKSGSDLSVDTMNALGPMNPTLVDEAITETDVQAGLFDSARFAVFAVNYRDLGMGAMPMRTGFIGRISTHSTRDQFTAELNGLLQSLQTTFGRFLTPNCWWTLGDNRCRKDLTAFIFPSTVEAVSADGLTIYDSSLTQSGPPAAANITGITNANPGVVTVDDVSELTNGTPVVISGVVGPSLLNTITVIQNLNVGAKTFEVPTDTSDTSEYPTYISGGTVAILGQASGYFDLGRVDWLTGQNAGLSMDIKSSAPGQYVLLRDMPFAIAVGDTANVTAGCDKTRTTCIDKFGNGPRHGGFPDTIGVDRLAQATNT